MRLVDYFNPLSDQFPDVQGQFGKLGFWSKVGVIAATALAGIGTLFLLGLGGVAAFRFTVKVLSKSEYSTETEKTDELVTGQLVEDSQSRKEGKKSTVCQGTRTQFNPIYNGQGRSACTSISLSAAEKLLQLESFDDVSGELIDQALDDGVRQYQSSGSLAEHSTVEDYDLSDYSLRREEFHDVFSVDGDPYSGIVNDFGVMLEDAVARLDFPTALVITKAPETVVLVCRSPKIFWLFDSHGGDGRKVFVEKCDSRQTAVAALTAKFPYLLPENPEEALQLDMLYNSFNVYAVKRTFA